jgi:NRAMP (natural resistance-associated macrophage protein)-like metal ion transporter
VRFPLTPKTEHGRVLGYRATAKAPVAQVFVGGTTSDPPHSPKGPTPSQTKKLASKRSFLQKLGPGLVTGASDDDPSGIATYSQVGAQFGLGMLWTMLFSYPLMAAIQEICARIGRVTGSGIANNIRRHYPRPVLYGIVSLLCVANIFNLGADIGAMAAAAQLLLGGGVTFYVLFFGLLSLLSQAYIPYSSYVNYLKWMTTALFAYVATAFVVHVPWHDVIHATLLPSISLNSTYFTGLVAVLGTTISPYLFFWQASQEAEEVKVRPAEEPLKRAPWQAFEQLLRIKIDTYVGMGFSNVVAFFIILTTAATLHVAGVRNVETSAQAAKALQPLAGQLAFVLFAAGIIGTGLLAVPVLAGSAAYGVAEAFQWRASLENKPNRAPKFYGVLAAATLIGLSLNFMGINPIRALFLAAVLNGLISAPLMVITMLLAANPKIMGQFTLSLPLKVAGWIATAVMLLVSLGFFVSQKG